MNENGIKFDYKSGYVSSLQTNSGIELISGQSPIFNITMRRADGETVSFDAYSADKCEICEGGAEYSGFSEDVRVKVCVDSKAESHEWKIEVINNTDNAIECVDFPIFSMKPLADNSGIGKLLFPYNEGVIISDAKTREKSDFDSKELIYPSSGAYFMFPNMMFSQFMAYLTETGGLYIGAHDAKRGLKALDYREIDGNIVLGIRAYTGGEFKEDYIQSYPIVTEFFDGTWEDAADIYRDWFEKNLPPRVEKVRDNNSLPKWYNDFPLVVTYPVRGKHDADEMTPNALFPYVNALPVIDEISEATDGKVMALLMHWEGTAPWAPPYVWPPYGGEEGFNEFAEKLHQKGNLLGVYSSGFGWTLKSELVDDYCKEGVLGKDELKNAMCTSPKGEVELSRICRVQRSGYDICPASDGGKAILDEAYRPMITANIDYAQILDQNHGGGQYLCYSRNHNHPPVPGAWMTENMQGLLGEWNNVAPDKLFGCESAAAEPFIGNLQFSDNRFEINYVFGTSVPLYAYLYHEYVHNFMGNQVTCPFDSSMDTLRMRMAYSFVAGDCLTLVLHPDGHFMSHWGCRGGEVIPDKEKTLAFIKNLTQFYKEKSNEYLLYGKMIKPIPVECDSVTVKMFNPVGENVRDEKIPKVYSTAWEYEGRKVQIFVNHTDDDVKCKVGTKTVTIKALSADLIEIQ